MEGGNAGCSRQLPERAGPAESEPDVFTTFAVRTLLGLTTKLESVTPKEEEAVLKAFQPLHIDVNTQANNRYERNDNDGVDDSENQHCESCTSDQADPMSGSRAELELEPEPAGQNEILLPHLRSVQTSLSESDNDAILVQGTLVHTTSDTESDGESKDPDADETGTSKCGLNNAALSAVALDGNNQSKEESDSEGYGHSDDTVGRDDTELHPPISQWLPRKLDSILEHDSSGKDRTLMDEQFSCLLATGECSPELSGEDQRPSADNVSFHKAALTERSFQLPAFFSGLRVRKKGLNTEDGETITEIKPRENDLALLKLRQPVKKSNITSGLTTKKKSSEPKASPTFLEQLSHLLNIDVSKNDERTQDSGAGFGETEDSDEGPENKASGQTEPLFPSEEIKSSPAESALDVFKALFTRPPKKETTADPSELEAIKRKMRNEKESLKAVFERSKSKPGDGPSDKSVGWLIFSS